MTNWLHRAIDRGENELLPDDSRRERPRCSEVNRKLLLALYSPKSHRLNFLRSQCEQVAPALAEAWPRDDRFSRRCFELLRQAYVNARYSPHDAITDEEPAWIAEHVARLQSLVEAVCRERLTA